MSQVIGLHHANAERIARREMPSLSEAMDIINRYTHDQVKDIAQRAFAFERVSPEELEAMLAYARVRFATDEVA